MNRTLLQPVFSVRRHLWRMDGDHSIIEDSKLSDVRSEVLKRDVFSCYFCSFKAKKYQEIHHIDENHNNNNPENLVTVCNLCHQVFHLGKCAVYNSGFIAAIPELTQTEINNLIRSAYVVDYMANNVVRDKIKSLLAIFQFRGCDTLKTLYGLDISTPHTLAEILSNCPDELFEKRNKLFSSLRLIANKEAFSSGQIKYYASNHHAIFLPDNLLSMSHRLLI